MPWKVGGSLVFAVARGCVVADGLGSEVATSG